MPDVTIEAADGGSFSAYIAGSGAAGIVVIQEIFGVNDVMRGITDEWAAKGYTAICPDLFWRQEPGVQISDKTEEDWKKAFALYQGFSETKGVEDLIQTVKYLRGTRGVKKVGAVGFCLGGKLAYLMATRSDVDAAVGYYGVGIDKSLDEASAITKPLLLHIAEKDAFTPPEAQAQIKAALAKNPLVEIETYPGQDHAFARPGGEHYDAASARRANARTEAFFAEHLKADS
ncbi:MAG: putative carboxymethylenebutenolidase [Rhodospirillales bacterium]|jgi:carboxymethylenebutenolidase|nr:putative carboxymethylenebutenolidase [Rhodospirillales bacterium]